MNNNMNQSQLTLNVSCNWFFKKYVHSKRNVVKKQCTIRFIEGFERARKVGRQRERTMEKAVRKVIDGKQSGSQRSFSSFVIKLTWTAHVTFTCSTLQMIISNTTFSISGQATNQKVYIASIRLHTKLNKQDSYSYTLTSW